MKKKDIRLIIKYFLIGFLILILIDVVTPVKYEHNWGYNMNTRLNRDGQKINIGFYFLPAFDEIVSINYNNETFHSEKEGKEFAHSIILIVDELPFIVNEYIEFTFISDHSRTQYNTTVNLIWEINISHVGTEYIGAREQLEPVANKVVQGLVFDIFREHIAFKITLSIMFGMLMFIIKTQDGDENLIRELEGHI